MRYYVSEVMMKSVKLVTRFGHEQEAKFEEAYDGCVGVLPVFSSREKAQAYRPDCGIVVIEVLDDEE